MIPDLVIRRGFLRTPFLPLIFLTVAGCDMSFIPADAIMHPTPENLPPQGGALIRAVVLSDGRVVIGDHSGPAKVFAPSTSGYELVGPLLRERPSTALHVDAMCSAEDRMFIHSRNLVDPNGDSLVIHEVSADSGRVLGSLAEAYRSEFARDRTMRSLGTVACADEPVSIVYGNYYFPIVKSYLPDGTHRWTALIEEYAQSPVYQNNPSEPTVAPRMGPSEYISSVQAMPSGFVVLQTALYEYVGEGEDWEWQVVRRRTYLLDGATGEGGLVSDSLPAISWTGDSTFVAEWSFPYPRIEVRLMSPSNLLRP